MFDLNAIGAAAFIARRRDDGTFALETINTAAERMTGLSDAVIRGRPLTELFPAEVASMLASNYAACLDSGETIEFERLVMVPVGEIATRTTLTPLLENGGEPARRLFGLSIDVTERHLLEEQLKSSNARLSIAVEALGGAHWYFDVRKKRFELSPAFEKILGSQTPATLSLDAWLDRVHPEDRNDTCFADIMAGRSEQGVAEFRVTSDTGDVRWLRCRRRAVADGPVVAGIAGVVLDITQDKRREEALSHQAASDPLTGLANRRRFEQVFGTVRDEAAQRRSALSLLMIDVDHFKSYNDTYGHVAGDAVLQRVASTIETVAADSGGTAARYGGEEFVMVLPGQSAVAAAKVADRLIRAVAAIKELHEVSSIGRVSVSVGVAGCAHYGNSGGDFIALADAALYRAKAEGRNCFRITDTTHLQSVGPDRTSTAA